MPSFLQPAASPFLKIFQIFLKYGSLVFPFRPCTENPSLSFDVVWTNLLAAAFAPLRRVSMLHGSRSTSSCFVGLQALQIHRLFRNRHLMSLFPIRKVDTNCHFGKGRKGSCDEQDWHDIEKRLHYFPYFPCAISFLKALHKTLLLPGLEKKVLVGGSRDSL